MSSPGASKAAFGYFRPLIAGLLAVTLHCWPLSAPRAEGPDQLTFGLIAVQDAQELAGRWQPLLAALSARLGIAVAPHVSKDYAGVVWAMSERADAVAWLGNKAAIEAVDNARGEVFARMGSAEWDVIRTKFRDTELASAAE